MKRPPPLEPCPRFWRWRRRFLRAAAAALGVELVDVDAPGDPYVLDHACAQLFHVRCGRRPETLAKGVARNEHAVLDLAELPTVPYRPAGPLFVNARPYYENTREVQ